MKPSLYIWNNEP